MARKFSSSYPFAAAAGLLIAGLCTAGTVQASTSAPAASSTARLQHATLRSATSAFPTSKTHSSGGAINITEDGKLQRFANRSNSPRPAVANTTSGKRTMRAASATSWLPSVSPTAVSTSRPGAVTGWQGLSEYSNQKYAGFSLEPPDQGLCAGNGYVFEMINDVVRVYSTTGTTQATAYLNDFFKEPGYQSTTDPSCVYDAGSNRFYALELTLDTDPNTGQLTDNTSLDLAVSKTGNPLQGWNIYTINATDDGSGGTPRHSGCPCIGDYPHLATDAHGVFMTTNEYPFSTAPGVFGNNFNGAQIYVLSKSGVAAGASSVGVTHFENVRVPTSSGPRLAGFTLLPTQSAGNAYATESSGTMYFTSTFAAEEARPDDFTGHGNQLGVWWISNTASLSGTPHLQLKTKLVTVGNYGVPPLANQKPGPTPLKDCLNVQCEPGVSDPYTPEQEGGLDSSDSRTMTSVYANGKIYAALDTAMLVNGSVQSGFEWFALGAQQASSSVARSGYVGVSGGNVIYPAITTDKQGNGYLGATLTGNNWFPSAAYGRWTGGMGSTVHVASAGKGPQDGFCEYRAFNCGGTDTPSIRPRWGDYGYGAWDGQHFYVANEYIASSCTFSQFNTDYTCNKTRTFYGNFSTHIEVLN